MTGSGRGGRRRRGPKSPTDPLEPYRRIRKPMPPPERVMPDRRRAAEEGRAEREMREAAQHPQLGSPRTPIPRVFTDRAEAGRFLAEALRAIARAGAVVLGIPRGGVVVAAVVAEALGLPLDVVIPRKVGSPGNPELGLGAIAEGVRVLDERLIGILGVTDRYLEEEIAVQEREIRRRTEAYRGGRDALSVSGRQAIVVDDGVATGGTAIAALRWARHAGAASVVFAVPVAPAESAGRLAGEADQVVVLSSPEAFYAVGQWYLGFPQVADAEVIRLLHQAGGRPATT